MTLSEANGSSENNAEAQHEASEFTAGVSETLQNGQSAEECIKKAQELLADGRRHLMCRSYQEAVDALDDACKLFCQFYGDMAFECADAYFYYGKSLIELERINQNIVNVKDNAEKEEEMSDEEDEEEEEEEANGAEPIVAEVDKDNDQEMRTSTVANEDALKKEGTEIVAEPNAAEPDESIDNVPISGQSVDVNGIGAETVVENNATENQVANGESPTSQDKTPYVTTAGQSDDVGVTSAPDIEPQVAGCSSASAGNDEKSEEEPEKDTNISIAWEMLDLARVIYEKKLTDKKEENADKSSDEVCDLHKNSILRLSEVRLALGEVCALNERYDDAVQEFSTAHDLLKSVCSDDDRRLAEIFFQIGSVSELDGKYEEAAKNIGQASRVLELRKQNLQGKLELPGQASDVDREEISREVDELVLLLKDIDERLSDLVESQRNNEMVKENLMQQLAPNEMLMDQQLRQQAKDTVSEPALTVTDVSHLVRKSIKRISGEVQAPGQEGCKRGKFDQSESPISGAQITDEVKQNGIQHDIEDVTAPVDEVPVENGSS